MTAYKYAVKTENNTLINLFKHNDEKEEDISLALL